MKNLLCLLPLLALPAFAASPPPANDDFANRTVLVSSGSISVAGRNASATTQASEPTITGDVVSRSVWWEWAAPFTGPVTITTAGSSFDTLLGVFTGTALGALTSIAENDDSGTGAFTSAVTFTAQSGIPYVILVGGYNGAGGKIQLGITVGTGPCSYTVSPTSKSFSNVAGTGSETVTTSTGCSWSAVSNDSFITITSGSTGTGSGTVTYSVTANTALAARTGTMTIAGTTVTISQAAASACTYSLSPTSASLGSATITNTIAMTAGTGCAWTATPNASWITIPSGASGTGSGTITYVLAANGNTAARTSTITAAGQTFTITQAGIVTCTYSISPVSASVVGGGASGFVNIATIGSCPWTASTNVSWISISTTNGSGNAAVGYTVNANTGAFRTGTLTVAGQTFTVFQAAGTCSYSILPSSVNVSSTNSTSTVTVASGAGCAWTAVSNVPWLTVLSSTSGNGNGSVSLSIDANLNTVARSGTLTIAGQTFTVNQAAAACIYSIVPTAAHYLAGGGPGNIAVTAGSGCAWTAISNVGWITVDSGTPGTANGTVGYTVTANATTVSRTGTITVAGSTFTVTQDGTVPCSYSLTPASANSTSLGGSGSVSVTANAGCAWSVSSSATWLTFTPGSGSGNGTVTYTVAANASSLTRTGTLSIADQTFTLTQAGTTCTYGIAPTSATYPSSGGVGTVAVTATSGCNWTSSSDSAWLVVTSGAAGTGNGSTGYSVTNNPSSVTRTGRLTIAGKLLLVTQTGVPCTYSISPTSAGFTASASGGTITVAASDSVCAWTATSGASWLTVSPGSGTGSGSVNYTVASTALAATRTGTLTVAGQTFTVTQTGDTTLPIVSLTVPANGSTISNVVTLTATATDSNMARVDFYLDAAVLLGSDLTSPYSLPYNTTNVANGAHNFYARAFDVAGNQGLSSTNAVTVSNAAPSTNTWALGFGAVGTDAGQSVAVDSSGNVIVAGSFTGSVDFGGGALASAGGTDIFVAKYSPAGAYIWAKRFGGTVNDRATSVAVDSSGNAIVTGTFMGTVNFGDGNVTSTFSGSGANNTLDVFILKLGSAAGAFVWKRKFDNTSANRAYGVAVDASDNILFCGSFVGSTSLNNDGFATFFTSNGGADIVLAKFAGASGVLTWARQVGGTDSDEAFGVAADPSTGDMLVTGYFRGTVNFGGGAITVTGGVADDIFLARYGTAAGAFAWVNTYGSNSTDRGQAVTVDSLGNVIFTGQFSETVNFGTGGLVSGGGQFDIFIAKYNSAGTAIWSKRAGSSSFNDYGISITRDSSNNVIATGQFGSTGDFVGVNLTSSGSSDVYALKLTSAGALSWANSYGGAQADLGNGVAASASAVFLTGSFENSATFNGVTLPGHGSSDADIFLLRTNP